MLRPIHTFGTWISTLSDEGRSLVYSKTCYSASAEPGRASGACKPSGHPGHGGPAARLPAAVHGSCNEANRHVLDQRLRLNEKRNVTDLRLKIFGIHWISSAVC